MSDREALEDLLKTVKPLAASGLKRPSGLASGQPTLAITLAERWSTKQRLIERLLLETNPRAALDLFETRTQDFIERNPELPGWRDKAGQEWRAALVVEACDEVRIHLDSWDAKDAFDDDDVSDDVAVDSDDSDDHDSGDREYD